MSLMLITHDLGVVAEITERVHVFYGGNVVESGLTKELFHSKTSIYQSINFFNFYFSSN